MTAKLIARYRRFAANEAHGVSPTYERFAQSVADSPALLNQIAKMPALKQQPNLLFAAARLASGLPTKRDTFAEHCLANWDSIQETMLTKSTQTNEPARCACFLPSLTQIEGPIAILEVGAAAGLCLLPDLYGYDFGEAVIPPPNSAAPVFKCEVSGPVPLPSSVPDIVWRAGLDLNPLDVKSHSDMTWLRMLVWPEQTDRRSRLDAAIHIAQKDPPPVVKGDLVNQIEELASHAPRDATLVIFHSAVLNYVASDVRAKFASIVGDLSAIWLANEGLGVVPGVEPARLDAARPGDFALARNGHVIATTGPHGQYLRWT